MLGTIHYAAVVVLVQGLCYSEGFSVKLRHLSTLYLPYNVTGSRTLQYGFDRDAVERAVYDSSAKLIYAVGKHTLHVINASDPANLTVAALTSSSRWEMTDVAQCSGSVFVSVIDNGNVLQGAVVQYRLDLSGSGSLSRVRTITIGAQPDRLLATKACTLVVALENPPVQVRGAWQDPPGGVGIIRFPNGLDNDPVTQTLNFEAFNSRFDELSRAGVRWVYRGNNNRFSDDVEPEYVTFNADQTKAYVGLQENNAIAVVDLQTNTITDIYGLGYKRWSRSLLDPSDADNGMDMAPWEVYGLYQPDGLQWFRWEGREYIVTANEGATKKFGNFRDNQRGHSFTGSEFGASVSPEMRAALNNNSRLGRLYLSTLDGKTQDGKFEKFYTFGARSFSIWRASDMAQVYDSGSELSDKTGVLRRELFNNDIEDGGSTVESGFDKASDDKGLEPESVAVAEVKGRLVLFVGLEKPGAIAVYSVAPGDGLQPRFESLYAEGIPQGNQTWNQMYEQRTLHAIDPESVTFIAAGSGLGDDPLLLVTGVVSGTVSLLKVEVSGGTGTGTIPGPVLGTVLSCLLVATLLSLHE